MEKNFDLKPGHMLRLENLMTTRIDSWSKISYIKLFGIVLHFENCVQPNLKLNFYSKLEIDLESYGLKCGKYKLQKDLPQHLITFLKRE